MHVGNKILTRDLPLMISHTVCLGHRHNFFCFTFVLCQMRHLCSDKKLTQLYKFLLTKQYHQQNSQNCTHYCCQLYHYLYKNLCIVSFCQHYWIVINLSSFPLTFPFSIFLVFILIISSVCELVSLLLLSKEVCNVATWMCPSFS